MAECYYIEAMENQIILNNLLVAYSKIGGGGVPIIFLHGWRSNKEVWREVSQLVSKSVSQSVDVYAIDLPGFGNSQIPKQAMTVADYASVVEQFITKLELKNVIIVGHSFGGRVGIKLAAQYPEIISKLVLVDAAGFAMDSNKKNKIRIIAKFAKPFFKPKFMRGLRNKIYQKIGSEDYLSTPELRQTYINVIDEDLSANMKQIACPTLIITGENDLDTPVGFGKRMNFLIHNSKFITLPNAGHFSFLDKPEEFKKLLNDFI